MKLVDVKIVLAHPEARVPGYAKEGDSGFDLHSVEQIELLPKQTIGVRTGLIMEVPKGYEVQIRPRSGMSLNTFIRVANAPGTIDSGFRGEVKVLLHNTGDTPYVINIGDRIAQGVLAEVPYANFIVTQQENLEASERGTDGLGASGGYTVQK